MTPPSSSDPFDESTHTSMNSNQSLEPSHIYERLKHLSLGAGDSVVLEFLANHSAQDDSHHRNLSSLSHYAFESTLFQHVVQRCLDRLVYILHIDNLIVYYIPKTGVRYIQQFGGIDHANQPIRIPETVNQFLKTIVLEGRRSNAAITSFLSVQSQIKQLFSAAPFDHTHHVNAKQFVYERIHLKSIFSLKGRYSKHDVENYDYVPPLLLLCSHYLKLIPWECLFQSYMTRVMSLETLNAYLDLPKQDHLYKPKFFTFYSEDELKYIQPIEKDRKLWTFSKFLRHMHVSNLDPHLTHDRLSSYPMHCPLIKYGKKSKSKSYRSRYKHMTFLQLSSLCKASNHDAYFVNLLSPLESSHCFPVFVFTLTDLLDMSHTIIHLINHHPAAVLLFMPDIQMIEAMTYLLHDSMMKVYDKPSYSSIQKKRFFSRSISHLRTRMNIQVVMYGG
eukprot:CAMPEP_0117419074 /NCGR_PEP_ID=MMETSP0758-20121206/720_1 /TAXON_ID=63605 /ORGANISM="Percolomonas cosmopolitus, Strain AE-1 (ATCC 50343)" /LENGTH=445 /DNA_ID=CAMNT_0005199943 /DNA_START=1740 /DNA_END=3073 /DNA_ORIENTATION=+